MNFNLKIFIIFFTLLNFSTPASFANNKTSNQADVILNNRIKIGPTVNSPIEYLGKIYFLATTGVLYQSNYDQSQLSNIFKTDLPSFSSLTLNGDILYFGEGLHESKISSFYAFDLKKNKLTFKVTTEGHIERAPLIESQIAYIGLGPEGVGAIDLNTQKFIWKTKTIKEGKLHVDATPVFYNNLLCSVSIYQFKGFFCLNPKNGNEVYHLKLSLSPKSELGQSDNLIYGYATEATMNDPKWNTESFFYIINLKEQKLVKEIKLRGYNFYAPILISSNEVFATLSTGDLITINLINGHIGYVGEFPEPFISNPYKNSNSLCAIGIMGQELCYSPVKGGYALSVEKRHIETPIGQIKNKINNKYYIPSRMGFFNL